MAELLYRCGGNYKTYFTASLPKKLSHIKVGDEITAEDLGYIDAEDFCNNEIGSYDADLDHNIIEVITIETTDFLHDN